ncbi:hypothetical protein [Akkermansia sp.]|uniref:hypothetical protein n=1 Tax=Akkermansia sp. TaxID=1872421 RepID=UPI0025BE4115|nr:hypothetical protein [Akkermansia sp.]
MIELFANYRINNPRSSGDVSNGNEGKLKCMVNKHFPVFFQARILPGNWELPALMDTLAGAGWRLLKENLRCAAERFFTHEMREPSVPRRGRCKSTVSFAGCLSPGKDGSLLLISRLFPFPDASFPEVRASLLRCGTKRKSIASGTEADDLRSMDKGNFPKTFFFQMFMLDSGLLIRCMVFSMFYVIETEYIMETLRRCFPALVMLVVGGRGGGIPQ